MSEQVRFDDQVAVVTGAGNGLGRSYALALAERGAKVLVNDLGGGIHGNGADATTAQRVADEITAAGGTALANGDTVATAAGGESIINQALAAWGQVDIVINNAGVVVSRGPIDENEPEDFVADLMVAAGGTFFVTRAVWRHMWERNYGRVVNVASGAVLGMLSAVGYPAAKAAVWGMTRSLAVRAQRGERDIRLNAIMPTSGSRITHLMGETIDAGMQRYYPPEAAVAPVLFLAHAEAPVSGEMFTTGGDRMQRVFMGVTPGYSSTTDRLTVEELQSNFDQVMDPNGHIVALTNLDKVTMDERVDWSSGIGKVF